MTSNALKLKDYIKSISDFRFVRPNDCPYSSHIGALFTDTILQAGVNYRHVVWPRVAYVLEHYPHAVTVSAFADVLEHYSTSKVLRWNNKEKLCRMNDLVSFCLDHQIETSIQLKSFLYDEENVRALKGIHGIGDKTCDYLKRLLGFDTVAVDRHIRLFIERANVNYNSYNEIKEVVEFTADFMNRQRRELDYSIWSYMSDKEKSVVELSFEF